MDVDAARAELRRALNAARPDDRTGLGFRAARQVLIDHGADALSLPRASGRSLDDIIGFAAAAALTPASRDFAVLLVHAIAVDGLMPGRGEAERLTRLFLERALLNPLRRAGYPFDGSPYDKRQALARLHATIDEHLSPPEPSIPRWIHGVGPADEA
jgi:hypothetical protein